MRTLRLLASLALPWLVVELALRALGAGGADYRDRLALFPRFPDFYEPDRDLGWVLRPNLQWKGTEFVVPFATNEHRERIVTGPSAASPPSAISDTAHATIDCIGDSSTFGYGADDAATYPAVLARLLREDLPKNQSAVVVRNRGVPGYNSLSAALISQRTDSVSALSLIMVGFNDHFPGRRTAREEYTMRRTAYACFQSRVCNSLFGFMSAGATTAPGDSPRYVAAVSPAEYRDNLSHAVRALRQRGSEPILLVYPSILDDEITRNGVATYWKQPRAEVDRNIDSHPQYQQITREVALAERARMVDLAAIFDATGNAALHLDWVHPNPNGYALIARSVEPAIRAALASGS